MADVCIDLRVVRGPDWERGDEDGGAGHLGTVVEVHSLSPAPPGGPPVSVSSGAVRTTEDAELPEPLAESGQPAGEKEEEGQPGVSVTVQWDCGHRDRYRCGEGGKYDLRVFDSTPTGLQHKRISCDGCSTNTVRGIRWKCSQCYDFDLCTHCYMSNKHNLDHRFVRYENERLKSLVEARKSARVQEAMGLFPPAKVVRGHDWSWGQQDGGPDTEGTITNITDWETVHYGASREVQWPKSGNEYRVGCEGMVDLKCVTPASGGNFYPDHLPVLGAAHCPIDPFTFVSSDHVRVELDAEIFQALQEDHGGWNHSMADLRGEIGVVHSITDSGDLRVIYGRRPWIINPSAVIKVDFPRYVTGDVVRIMDDLAEVTKLQKDYGGWNEEMASALGQLGQVHGVDNMGGVVVLVNGNIWKFNPLCVKLAEKEEQGEAIGVDSDVLGADTMILQLRMQALREQDDSEVLHHAALLGKPSVIREYLSKYPNEVDVKVSGKTALHCAIRAGAVSVVEVLLEFRANMECGDEDGFRPLHHCAIRDSPELATMLLKAGADPNCKSNGDHTPLMLAAIKSNMKVLPVLLKCPDIRLYEQDSDGDTALHCAVHSRKFQSVRMLLEARADPTLVNFQILTPLHLAAKVGFLSAVEWIVQMHPEHVNTPGEAGVTALHVAAEAGEFEVAKILLENEQCKVDPRTEAGHTPLHTAITNDHSRMVELLIGYGADPSIRENEGKTALHLVLDNDDLDSPSEQTAQLNKVRTVLMEMTDDISGQLVVACFLVQEGAELDSMLDETLLSVCSPEMAVLVSTFAEKYAKTGTYGGSLRQSATNGPSSSLEKHSEDQTTLLMTNAEKISETDGVLKPPEESSQNHTASPPSTVSHTQDSQTTAVTGKVALCCLCDHPIRVRFEPCGHSTLCQHCAGRAKRCPECKTPVQSLSEIHL